MFIIDTGVSVIHTPETAEVIADGGCPTYWRSHSCDLRAGHTELHTCTPGFLYYGLDDPDPEPTRCDVRSGHEDDVVHIDPIDGCDDRDCQRCYRWVSDPAARDGRRAAGRERPLVLHDPAACYWCRSITATELA